MNQLKALSLALLTVACSSAAGSTAQTPVVHKSVLLPPGTSTRGSDPSPWPQSQSRQSRWKSEAEWHKWCHDHPHNWDECESGVY